MNRARCSSRRLAPHLCALVLTMGGLAMADDPVTLLAEGFEAGLAGWNATGDADFDTDAAQPHGGEACARITIPAGAEPRYQKLELLLEGILPGDEFTVEGWVRTEGLTEGTGGYFAFVFLDDAGERTGIAHPKVALENGRNGWERLFLTATAPKGTSHATLDLVLNSVGTAWYDDVSVVRTARLEPWPDLGDAERQVRIDPDTVVQPRFAGVGFHVFFHCHGYSRELLDTVLLKHWRELNPSFARMTDLRSWDRAKLDEVAEACLALKETGAEIYYTSWDPPVLTSDEERGAYAEEVADTLEYLIRERGATNLRWYCMSNELSLAGWGAMASDLPTFRAYHQALYDAFEARGLDVGLLATDASPVEYWHTLEWAAENMDDITAIYGGHHYFNNHSPDDERFYPWFRDRLAWAAGIARSKGKDFLIGEFGCKQDGRTVDGVKLDRCVYFETPDEPLIAIQLADAVIAALNSGVYAVGYWTYSDFPDEYNSAYVNKWGVIRWSGDDHSTRDHYYGYGLLTKFCRGPAEVFAVTTDDPHLRAAALRSASGAYTVVALNRARADAPVRIALPGAPNGLRFRRYLYDPAAVPRSPHGDLQGPSGALTLTDGALVDRLGPNCLAVYTTAYDDEPPGPVTGLEIERGGGQATLTWEASPDADLCYYRVFRSATTPVAAADANRIGSTVGTTFVDHDAPEGEVHYRVVAVDQSGNASE